MPIITDQGFRAAALGVRAAANDALRLLGTDRYPPGCEPVPLLVAAFSLLAGLMSDGDDELQATTLEQLSLSAVAEAFNGPNLDGIETPQDILAAWHTHLHAVNDTVEQLPNYPRAFDAVREEFKGDAHQIGSHLAPSLKLAFSELQTACVEVTSPVVKLLTIRRPPVDVDADLEPHGLKVVARTLRTALLSIPAGAAGKAATAKAAPRHSHNLLTVARKALAGLPVDPNEYEIRPVVGYVMPMLTAGRSIA